VKNRRSALFFVYFLLSRWRWLKICEKNVSSGSGFTQKMSQRVKGKTGKMVTDGGENSGKRAVLAALERKIRRSEWLF
jgi:membrane protein implicated in regulation of membrane protease activity